MLLNGFFMTDPYNPIPYWNGHVFFESSTPGTYSVVIPKNIKCGYIGVGGGAGGFCAKLGINAGGSVYSGLAAFSGASGNYKYREYTFTEDTTLNISVGAGRTAYASSNLYGTITQGNPSLTIFQSGGDSSIGYIDPQHGYYITHLFAGGGGNGEFYFSDPSNPNSYTYNVSEGGNNGTAIASGSNKTATGGTSVYKGYGKGGSSGWTGDNQSGTPWADNGGSGYIKIFAILPD